MRKDRANGYCTNKKETFLSGISTFTGEREATRDVDLIRGSVPDDPDLKGRIFSRFNTLLPRSRNLS